MNGRAFVDTNILVYAHDRSAGRKHEIASELLRRLWDERQGVISTQVLQEFYVNVRRRAASPLPRAEAVSLVEDYLAWDVVVNDGTAITEAFQDEELYGISFWDALIVRAANIAAVSILFTEDLNHGQRYGKVDAVNPFIQ